MSQRLLDSKRLGLQAGVLFALHKSIDAPLDGFQVRSLELSSFLHSREFKMTNLVQFLPIEEVVVIWPLSLHNWSESDLCKKASFKVLRQDSEPELKYANAA